MRGVVGRIAAQDTGENPRLNQRELAEPHGIFKERMAGFFLLPLLPEKQGTLMRILLKIKIRITSD